MLASATITRTRPPWVAGDKQAYAWLTLGGDVAMPLSLHRESGELVAVTTVASDTIGDEGREWKAAARRTFRAGKSAYRHAQKRQHGRPRPGPEIDED